MNIKDPNRRWPQPGEQWITTRNRPRLVRYKIKTKLILDIDTERTHSGICEHNAEFNLITYLK